jgi:cytochrome bd-type quinol oxidase subunit 2
MKRVSTRTLIWACVIVELLGLGLDALWHGLLHPEFEATSVGEMVRHLATVHLILYLGVLGLLVSTVRALVERARESAVGIAVPVMVAGAAVQAIGETWHAYSHLQMRPSPAPELIGFVGLAAVVVALLVSRRQMRGRATKSSGPGRHTRSHGV